MLAPVSPVQLSLLRIFDLTAYAGPADPRIEIVSGDIRDASAVHNACRGIDLVIHSAAGVDWGTKPEEEVLSVNFGGTENVVNACREQRVRHLVYTSSLDAIFGGARKNSPGKADIFPEKLLSMRNFSELRTSYVRQ